MKENHLFLLHEEEFDSSGRLRYNHGMQDGSKLPENHLNHPWRVLFRPLIGLLWVAFTKGGMMRLRFSFRVLSGRCRPVVPTLHSKFWRKEVSIRRRERLKWIARQRLKTVLGPISLLLRSAIQLIRHAFENRTFDPTLPIYSATIASGFSDVGVYTPTDSNGQFTAFCSFQDATSHVTLTPSGPQAYQMSSSSEPLPQPGPQRLNVESLACGAKD